MVSTTPTSDAALLQVVGLDPKKAAKKAKKKAKGGIVTAPGTDIPLAPMGVDPHSMPVSAIVFDPRLLDGFTLDGSDCKAASDKVFALYRGRRGDTERNSLLHLRIGTFIKQVKAARKLNVPAKSHVKDKVRTSKKQRELLEGLAQLEIHSLEDLQALLTPGEKDAETE